VITFRLCGTPKAIQKRTFYWGCKGKETRQYFKSIFQEGNPPPLTPELGEKAGTGQPKIYLFFNRAGNGRRSFFQTIYSGIGISIKIYSIEF